MKTMIVILFVMGATMRNVAVGGATLLWSLGLSGNVTTPPQSDQRVQFVLQSSPGNDASGTSYDLVSPLLTSGDRRTVIFSPANPPDFNGLAHLMTNGQSDDLGILWRWANDACPFPCAGQGGLIGEFDLAGNKLDYVELDVDRS